MNTTHSAKEPNKATFRHSQTVPLTTSTSRTLCDIITEPVLQSWEALCAHDQRDILAVFRDHNNFDTAV